MSGSFASHIEAASQAIFVAGDVDAIGRFFAPDYVVHVTDQVVPPGHGVIQAVVGLYRRAFPDLEVAVDILVEDDARIAWQRTMRATHTGAFKGFPASGRAIVWREMVTSRFAGGLIAEEWVITDLAERLLLARKR